MFPPDMIFQDEDDIDLTPHSVGLRDSIRFSVYEHVMGDKLHNPKAFHAIQTRLLSWCNLPGYTSAYQSLKKYTQEVKKLEEVCFELLHDIESRPNSLRASSFITRASMLSTSDGSHNSVAVTSTDSTSSSPVEPQLFEHLPMSPISPGAPPVPHPLLKGMPGREISAAKTDGAGFAGDFEATKILIYPNDLSRTEYDEHPLAKHLDLTSRQKAQLGLILPKQLNSRDF